MAKAMNPQPIDPKLMSLISAVMLKMLGGEITISQEDIKKKLDEHGSNFMVSVCHKRIHIWFDKPSDTTCGMPIDDDLFKDF